MPRFAHAAQGRDPRLVTIILRGAMDGLSAVAPLGDPDYAALRAGIALSEIRRQAGAPARRLLRAASGHAQFRAALQGRTRRMVVHATATAYRERSHFDGQDVLESGLAPARAASTAAG